MSDECEYIFEWVITINTNFRDNLSIRISAQSVTALMASGSILTKFLFASRYSVPVIKIYNDGDITVIDDNINIGNICEYCEMTYDILTKLSCVYAQKKDINTCDLRQTTLYKLNPEIANMQNYNQVYPTEVYPEQVMQSPQHMQYIIPDREIYSKSPEILTISPQTDLNINAPEFRSHSSFHVGLIRDQYQQVCCDMPVYVPTYAHPYANPYTHPHTPVPAYVGGNANVNKNIYWKKGKFYRPRPNSTH